MSGNSHVALLGIGVAAGMLLWGRNSRGGVEYNYRMIVVSDAVAEVDRTTHEAELRTMARIFADVKATGEVVGMLDQCQGR